MCKHTNRMQMNAFVDFWHLCLEPWKEAVKYQIGSFAALAEFWVRCSLFFFKPSPRNWLTQKKGFPFFLTGIFLSEKKHHLCGGFEYCWYSPRNMGKWSNLTNGLVQPPPTRLWDVYEGQFVCFSEWIIFFGRQAGKTNYQRRAYFPTNPLWWFQICCFFTQKHGEMMQLDLHIFCKWVGSTTDYCTI